MKANTGSPITTGSDIRGRLTPPSTSMPAVIASSSDDEPKSGCSSSSPTSSTDTPSGLSIAGPVALTSSRKRTRKLARQTMERRDNAPTTCKLVQERENDGGGKG